MSQQYVGSAGPYQPVGPDKTERPLKELFVELWENTEKLVRQEAKLASIEVDTKVSKLKTDVSAMAIGGAMLYAGLLALIAGVILLLGKFIAPWLAALLVGGAVVGVGYALLQKRKNLSDDLVPRRTIQHVKEDVHTFTEAMR